VPGTNGLLYGTTEFGGAFGDGTIFSLSTNGTFTTLASFAGTNGAQPVAGLIQGTNGDFFGTTQFGGSNSAGTLFNVTTNGVLTSIYSFASNVGSANPFSSLMQDDSGNFYGLTLNDSIFDAGNIFKVTPDGAVATFYTFPGGVKGTWPAAALALGPDGNFYGMTTNGGNHTNGNVFRITPGGIVTNIYSFTGGPDGYAPAGQLALGADGDFYGVTSYNTIQGNLFYGTVFKITPGGALTTLYKLDGFVNFTDGVIPLAGLCQGSDGNFYGTTYTGYDINYDGNIYNSSYGTVFSITPSGTFATLTALNGADDGANPKTALVQGSDGNYYGTTSTGGPGGQGTIYRIAFTTAPQIATQPVNQTNVIGTTATFNVTVFGAPQLQYQWQFNGTSLSDSGNVAGSTSRILTINNVSMASAGTYSVTVKNNVGLAESGAALLSVEEAPLFQGALQSGGSFVFTWSAMIGRNYQLQSTASLRPAQWTNYGGLINATNSVMGATGVIGAGSQQFYRLVLLP
jgi:uncharacterized repeat protein (TIGR03803 family)